MISENFSFGEQRCVCLCVIHIEWGKGQEKQKECKIEITKWRRGHTGK
jgi:hypothetical protein